MKHSDQDLISNVYRASTSGCDVGGDSIWSVAIISRLTIGSVVVHAPNVSTAKRIARQYAQRIMGVTDARTPMAELLSEVSA